MQEITEKLVTQYKDYRVVFISAIAKENIDDLRQIMTQEIEAEYKIRYPYRALHF